MSLAVAACGLVPTSGPTISRDGTTLVISVPGYNLRPVQGFLCPTDPGVGPTIESAGFADIMRAGCLDLGLDAGPAQGGWSGVVNLESLSSAELEAFAQRPTYRLLLISGAGEPRSVFAADVPAVSLMP